MVTVLHRSDRAGQEKGKNNCGHSNGPAAFLFLSIATFLSMSPLLGCSLPCLCLLSWAGHSLHGLGWNLFLFLVSLVLFPFSVCPL